MVILSQDNTDYITDSYKVFNIKSVKYIYEEIDSSIDKERYYICENTGDEVLGAELIKRKNKHSEL